MNQMNPIQDILIAFNQIREEVISKSKTFDRRVFQHNKIKYTLYYNSYKIYNSRSLIDIERGEECIFNLYLRNKDEIFLTYKDVIRLLPFGIYDLEEESKKDDAELVLTHGKDLIFLKQNKDEIIQRINLSLDLLGRIK